MGIFNLRHDSNTGNLGDPRHMQSTPVIFIPALVPLFFFLFKNTDCFHLFLSKEDVDWVVGPDVQSEGWSQDPGQLSQLKDTLTQVRPWWVSSGAAVPQKNPEQKYHVIQ